MARIGRGEDYILTNADAWRIRTLQESGELLEDILAELSRYTKREQQELLEAFEDAGITAISFTYAKGGTLKLGGPNNGYGTFEVYDADGNVICKINNTDGFKNIKGSEWAQIKESIFSAGYGSLTDGVLDLSAQYDDGRHVVLSAISGDLIFKISRYFRIEGLKAVTSGSSMLYNSSSYYAGYSSASSKRYKVLGKTVREDELEDLYRIKVIWAKYKDGYLMEQDERCGKEMPMFIAEDIDRRFPIAVDHDKKGRAENWNYRIMIPCMFAMLKNEHEKVKNLQSELESIKTELTELKEVINQYIVKKKV